MSHLFTLHAPLAMFGAEGLRVIAYAGREAISRLYEYEVYFTTPPPTDAELAALQDAVAAGDAHVWLEATAPDGTPRGTRHGVFTAVETVQEYPPDAQGDGGATIFRAVLAPRLWRLTLTRRSRVFVEKSVVEIVASVLADAGLGAADVDLEGLRRSAARPFVCQYRESDFDFVSRWLEREGIYYYFDHPEGGDGGREKLVLSDSVAHEATRPAEPVPFAPSAADALGGEPAFATFRMQTSRRPASVSVRDFDHAVPAAYLAPTDATAPPVPDVAGGLPDVYAFGDNVRTADEAARIALVRRQQLDAQRVRYRGRGRVYGLAPGYFFTLAVDASQRAGMAQDYLVVEQAVRGADFPTDPRVRDLFDPGEWPGAEFAADVTALPRTRAGAAVQFRPELVTPTPRIYGVESATVEADHSPRFPTRFADLGHFLMQQADELVANQTHQPTLLGHVDEDGCYRVRFHFDQSSAAPGEASAPVRMMQPYAGMSLSRAAVEPETADGMHFPLHAGTEVVVVFLGGDPDRPVIAGAMPTGRAKGPALAENRETSVIQSQGGNQLALRDLAPGQQRVTLSSPPENSYLELGAGEKNFELHTDRDGEIKAGHDLEVRADHDLEVTAGHNQTIETGVDKQEMVIGNTQEMFVGNKQEVTVGNFDGLNVSTTGEVFVGARFDATLAADVEIFAGPRVEMELATVQEITVARTDAVRIAEVHENSLSSVNELTVGMRSEVFVGNRVEASLATTTSLYVGAKTDTYVGAVAELNVAGSAAYSLAAKVEMLTGLVMDFVLGGVAIDVNLGVAIIAGTCEISEQESAMHDYESRITKAETNIQSHQYWLVDIDETVVFK